MNKAFSFWKNPFLAFYSKPFYRHVATEWKGLGFAYLFFLLLVCSLPFTISFINFVRQDVTAINAQIPPLKLVQGELVTEVAMPHFIELPDNQGLLAVIDTAAVAGKDNDKYDALALFTKDHIVFGQTQVINLPDIDLELNQDRLLRAINLAGTLFNWPIITMFSFLFRVFQAFIFSLIGLVIANMIKVSIPYISLLRLSVVVLTPIIIVKTLLDWVFVSGFIWPLFAFVAAMIYLHYALSANRPDPSVEEQAISPS